MAGVPSSGQVEEVARSGNADRTAGEDLIVGVVERQGAVAGQSQVADIENRARNGRARRRTVGEDRLVARGSDQDERSSAPGAQGIGSQRCAFVDADRAAVRDRALGNGGRNLQGGAAAHRSRGGGTEGRAVGGDQGAARDGGDTRVSVGSAEGQRAGSVLGQRSGGSSDDARDGHVARAAQSQIEGPADRAVGQAENPGVGIDAAVGAQRDHAAVGVVAPEAAQGAAGTHPGATEGQGLIAHADTVGQLQGRTVGHNGSIVGRAQGIGIADTHRASGDGGDTAIAVGAIKGQRTGPGFGERTNANVRADDIRVHRVVAATGKSRRVHGGTGGADVEGGATEYDGEIGTRVGERARRRVSRTRRDVVGRVGKGQGGGQPAAVAEVHALAAARAVPEGADHIVATAGQNHAADICAGGGAQEHRVRHAVGLPDFQNGACGVDGDEVGARQLSAHIQSRPGGECDVSIARVGSAQDKSATRQGRGAGVGILA